VTGAPAAALARHARWLWLVPVALAFLAMLPSVSGELVWDDVFWQRQVAYFTSLAAVLRPPADIPDWPAGYFRPVATLSWLLDLRLWGPEDAAGRHLSNLAFHALATLGAWLLARRLLAGSPGREAGALAAATLFAVHPVHTESVCWVGARVDVLATMFLLPALLLALAWRDRRSVPALLAAPACFLLAMGAKEVGVAGLALMPLVVALAPPLPGAAPAGGRARAAALTWVPLAVAFAGAAALYAVLRQSGAASVGAELGGLDPARLVRATGWYVAKLAWPWPQLNYVTWENVPGVAAAAGAVLAALALTGWAARTALAGRGTLPLLGLLWTGIALAPSLVVALSGFAANPVAERYLYLPSVGAALAAGGVVARLAGGRSRRVAAGALAATAALAAVFLAATLLRSLDWTSNVRLWSTATRQVTTHGQPWVELATAHYAAGDYDAALDAFRTARALEISPGTLAVAEYNAGLIHLKRRQWREAEDAFTRSRTADPRYALARYGLGRVSYERALEPGEADARLALLERAQQSFLAAIGLSPGFGEPRLQLVKIALARGDLLAGAGEAERAAASYGAGLAQLETLLRALPALAQDPAVAALRADLQAKAGD
jgi:tetratricopeptide (TPR) repeat protein